MLSRPASSLLHALIVTIALLPFGGVSAYWHTVTGEGASRMQGPTPLALEPNTRLTAAVLSERHPWWHPWLAQPALKPSLLDVGIGRLLASFGHGWMREVTLVTLGRLQLEGG